MQVAALFFLQAPAYCTVFIDLLVDLLHRLFLTELVREKKRARIRGGIQ